MEAARPHATTTAAGSRLAAARAWTAQLSARSWVVAIGGTLTAVAVYGVRVALEASDASRRALAASDVGEALLIFVAATLVLVFALRLPRDDALRGQWLMIGGASAAFAAGDVAWASTELARAVDPAYLWPADLLYLAAAALGIALTGAVCYMAILPVDVGRGDEATRYELRQTGFHAVPHVLIMLFERRSGAGRITVAWLFVAVAMGLMGLTDAIYGLLAARGLYLADNPVDLGWMLGSVLIATAASIALEERAGIDALARDTEPGPEPSGESPGAGGDPAAHAPIQPVALKNSR
jgi:hypothetical protein